MRAALAAASRAAARGEVPVGALVVLGGKRVASGGNRTVGAKDPSAHAEIVALRRAARRAGNHRLVGATLYVTLEPCLMCLGAMVQARIQRLVYAADDPKAGAVGLLDDAAWRRRLNHRFELSRGLLGREASQLLKEFFAARRRGRTGA
ncbi:MAG: nucleoside deaminase [Acidobacteria bacterium]|nr:nucleoside deaminase [Acidobacteriota bacterium]